MIDNTEETLVNGMSEETKRSVMDAANSGKKKSRSFKAPWKKVAIGGVSGVMLGVASAFAIDKLMDYHASDDGKNVGDEEGLKVATKVDDDQSFKEAFDTAHDEIGPGGLFEWHGNIYSTYKDDEWEALSSDEQDAFSERIVAQLKETDEPTVDQSDNIPDASDSNDVIAMTDDADDDIKIIGADDSAELAQNDDVYVVEVEDSNSTLETVDDLLADISGEVDTVSDALEGLSDDISEQNFNVAENVEDNYLADNADSASSGDDVFMA